MNLLVTILLAVSIIYQSFKSTLIIFCFKDLLRRLNSGNESWVNEFVIQAQVNDGVPFHDAKMIDLEHRDWKKLSIYRKSYKIMSLSGISIISTVAIWMMIDAIFIIMLLFFK
ncbi:hypothetical protein P7410_16730 [Vibrio parahaemolyticus]|nr:hypothetical protein [Vibrio parahaemolyticus]